MSGLREGQREAEVLVTLIFASLPAEPRWFHRWQASSHRICADTDFSATPRSNTGARWPAMRPGQAQQI